MSMHQAMTPGWFMFTGDWLTPQQMKDPYLLPSILPNIFIISSSLSSQQFASRVLPSLKPLFSIKEPPQNMLTLLENLGLVQEKCEKPVFRERAYA
jgi:SCY1-like protein 2